MKSLQLKELGHTFDSTGFTTGPLDLEIEKGQLHTILGPSGSGKSTVLKLASGLLSPTEGSIILDGKDITAVSASQRGIAMIFQQPLLFPGMTLLDNTAFGLKMKKVEKKTRRKKSRELLERVGIGDYASAYPHELSGGQQQRGAIARALALDPEIILMDEPFSALDPELRWDMRHLVKSLQKEKRTTVVFVTHDREEAFFMSDMITVMRQGKTVQSATPHDLYYFPSDSDTARFIGHSNLLLGQVSEQTFSTDDLSLYSQKLRPYSGTRIELILPPESFVLADAHRQDDKNKQQLYLEVESTNNRQGFLHLDCVIGKTKLKLMIKNDKRLNIVEGSEISVYFDPDDIIIPES